MPTPTGSQLFDAARALQPALVADRRAIHLRPELAFTEVQTAALVAARLAELGIEAQTGVAGTGVVGLIRGASPGKTVLLRADMDCLPIEEQNDEPYKSQNAGLMHACGHDGHTSMLLGAARLLNERRDSLRGNVKLMFQPAEEHGEKGGALPMIEEGDYCDGVDARVRAPRRLLAGERPDRPARRAGHGGAGPLHDRGARQGRSRGAPHLTVDPIVIAAHIVTALQTIVSREISPFDLGLVTVGNITGGETFNVIPDTARIRGTVRTYTPAMRAFMQTRVTALATGVASAMRATAEMTYNRGYPAVVNHEEGIALLGNVADDVLGPGAGVEMEMQMVGEDFSYLLEKVPGAMFFLGVRHPSWQDERPIHTASFNLDEDALPAGAAMLAGTALRYLEGA